MKTIRTSSGTFLIVLVLGTVLTISCRDKYEPNGDNTETIALRVINCAGPYEILSLWVDNERVIWSAYADIATPYVRVSPGTHEVRLSERASDPPDFLCSGTFTFRAGIPTTIAVLESLPPLLNLIAFEDDWTTDSSQAKLRLIHLASSLPVLNFGQAGNPDIFINVSYTEATAYARVPAQIGVFDFEEAASHDVLFSVLDIELNAGQNYTMFLCGDLTVSCEPDSGDNQ